MCVPNAATFYTHYDLFFLWCLSDSQAKVMSLRLNKTTRITDKGSTVHSCGTGPKTTTRSKVTKLSAE